MARPSKREKMRLTTEEIEKLETLSRSRTEEVRKVQRAKIILKSYQGMSDSGIARNMDIDINTVRLCISKCLSYGVEAALVDMARSGAPTEIGQEEKAWIIHLACESPETFGYPQATWTYSLLLRHIQDNAETKGFPILKNLARSKLWSILNATDIKPHKVTYYLDKRDPEFEVKMFQILCVYKEIEVILNSGDPEKAENITISYDEKPGIQATGNTAKDLRPEPYKYKSIGRDFEYVRHGTQSLLAGINLLTGEITATVSDTHKSSDFILFLSKLDEKYDKSKKIRIVLDNHSAHVSKETMKYLETIPNRFEFIFTPKHGSWLNLIESFFSKLTRVFLRGLRVGSKEELRERLLQYIAQINLEPVVFKWKYKMDEINL